jgi:hypothetical protein
MKHQPASEGAESTPIMDPPNSPDHSVIYLGERRKEELDPVDIPIPDEEIIDPVKIEPTGDYRNTERPSNVEGTDNEEDGDDQETDADLKV